MLKHCGVQCGCNPWPRSNGKSWTYKSTEEGIFYNPGTSLRMRPLAWSLITIRCHAERSWHNAWLTRHDSDSAVILWLQAWVMSPCCPASITAWRPHMHQARFIFALQLIYRSILCLSLTLYWHCHKTACSCTIFIIFVTETCMLLVSGA